jgi:hypothetical protein
MPFGKQPMIEGSIGLGETLLGSSAEEELSRLPTVEV